MDGDGIAERVWLETFRQPDTERVADGIGAGVLVGAVLGSNGGTVTRRRIARGLWLDATVRTRRLCNR